MANYQIMHPLKLKNLSKKQKQSFKKNYFSFSLLYADGRWLEKVETGSTFLS